MGREGDVSRQEEEDAFKGVPLSFSLFLPCFILSFAWSPLLPLSPPSGSPPPEDCLSSIQAQIPQFVSSTVQSLQENWLAEKEGMEGRQKAWEAKAKQKQTVLKTISKSAVTNTER